MPFNAPSIKFPTFDFTKLINKLSEESIKLRQGSNTRSTTFRKDIEKFKTIWLKDEDTYILTDIEIRSVSMYLLEARESFKDLIDVGLLKEFVEQISNSTNVTNQKRLIELTFQYFQLLQGVEFTNVMQIATSSIENFSGRNILLKEFQQNLPYLYQPSKMLFHYGSKEEIQRRLSLSVDGDYYKTILILNLVAELDSINDGQEETALFEDITRHKDYIYEDNLHVGEYTVRILIKKMMSNTIGSNFDHWMTFIIDLLGDPRTVSRQNAHNVPWERVGKEYKEFLIRVLSKASLKLFLNALSNPEHDEIYQYRKQFWSQFSEYVQYAKLFITENDLRQLPEHFRKLFNGKNSSYSRISDSSRSCIYIDLGELKIIEGTNNAMVRLYSEAPIDLNKTRYHYQEFYRGAKAQDALISEITHSYSHKGKWQNKLLNQIKQVKHVDISLRDTLL